MPAAGRDAMVVAHSYTLQQFLKSIQLEFPVDVKDATTFGKNSKVKHPILKDGSFSATGFLDSTIEAVEVALRAVAGRPWTVGPAGLARGARAHLFGGVQNAFAPSAPVDDLVQFTIGALATGGTDGGVSLFTPQAISGPFNETAVDNGAATINGGVGHLHNLLIGGSSPSMIVKIQHSSDNVSFVDLITFAAVTATDNSQRIEVTGTVNRYLRASLTITGGSPAFYPVIAFARR